MPAPTILDVNLNTLIVGTSAIWVLCLWTEDAKKISAFQFRCLESLDCVWEDA